MTSSQGISQRNFDREWESADHMDRIDKLNAWGWVELATKSQPFIHFIDNVQKETGHSIPRGLLLSAVLVGVSVGLGLSPDWQDKERATSRPPDKVQ